MNTTVITQITPYLIPALTALTGWFAGTRKRKNSFLQDLQESINLLSSENRRLIQEITTVNGELISIKAENAELKSSVDRLCKENSQLKEEVRGLSLQLSEHNLKTK